jgi:hypothetical protein
MNDEIPPIGPADLTLLGYLLVGQLMGGSLICIEFPRTKIHELFMKIRVKTFGRLPGKEISF